MMCPLNIELWCFVLLLVTSFSRSQGNSTNGDEWSDNSTVRNNLVVSSMKYQNETESIQPRDACKDSIKNDGKMQHKSCANSTENNRKNDDSMRYDGAHIMKNREQNNEMSYMESHVNPTEIDDSVMLQKINENQMKTEGKNDYMSNKLHGDSNVNFNNVTIVPNENCTEKYPCVQLCCPFGQNLTVQGKCVDAGQNDYIFPQIFIYNNSKLFVHNQMLNKLPMTVRDPCVEQKLGRDLLSPNYYFLANGSLYLLNAEEVISPSTFCIAILMRDIYDVIVCNKQTKFPMYISACLLISLPFLLLTFIVYTTVPELKNMHGYTLRAHVASLFVTYIIMFFGQQMNDELIEWKYCVQLAYLFNFTFLASFFWLNVTCFDIWWTFTGLRSYQATGIKQDKKKILLYSLYALGIPFIINIICVIMDYTPGISSSTYIKPAMCKTRFWFIDDEAKSMYFYVPMGFTVISNICFFVITSLTILYKNIYTAHQMRDVESKRHSENKQRFFMYLKLFIVMGISWIMEVISWSIDVDVVPAFVWYPFSILNALQGIIIFWIFVWTKKVKQLLLKRYGGRSCGPWKIPMANSMTATASTTTSSSVSSAQAMKNINSSNNKRS